MQKKNGKVREIRQSKKVGTMMWHVPMHTQMRYALLISSERDFLKCKLSRCERWRHINPLYPSTSDIDF